MHNEIFLNNISIITLSDSARLLDNCFIMPKIHYFHLVQVRINMNKKIEQRFRQFPDSSDSILISRFHIRRRTSRLDEQIVSKSSFSRTNHQM